MAVRTATKIMLIRLRTIICKFFIHFSTSGGLVHHLTRCSKISLDAAGVFRPPTFDPIFFTFQAMLEAGIRGVRTWSMSRRLYLETHQLLVTLVSSRQEMTTFRLGYLRFSIRHKFFHVSVTKCLGYAWRS